MEGVELWDVIAEAAPNAVLLTAIDPPTRSTEHSIADVSHHEEVSITKEYVAPAPTITQLVSIHQADLTLTTVRNSVTPAQCNELFLATTQQSIDTMWQAHRKCRITASKMGDVYRTACRDPLSVSKTVIRDVMGTHSLPRDRLPKPMRWGMEHEQVATEAYLTYMGRCHRNLNIRSTGLYLKAGEAHLGASADGIVTCDCCWPRLLEVKCP